MRRNTDRTTQSTNGTAWSTRARKNGDAHGRRASSDKRSGHRRRSASTSVSSENRRRPAPVTHRPQQRDAHVVTQPAIRGVLAARPTSHLWTSTQMRTRPGTGISVRKHSLRVSMSDMGRLCKPSA